MDTYFTIEEKYLQAVDEMRYGETPMSLKLLNQILAEDPSFVRAHFQIGILYYYDLHDYQSAGYHFKVCTELEPSFPDVYFHYLKLLVFLNMERQVNLVAAKALTVAGVPASAIYNFMGLCAESNQKLDVALALYHKGLMLVANKNDKDDIEENIGRVKFKVTKSKAYTYHIA
jgi:tetratricopeptide (TPR) repeat protein